nr:flagellar export chaperone FliS [uncultured Pseudodesulfovibrio sp.]
MANPAKAYLATQIETTTQGDLLLMLYEAAIKFLKQAKVEIDKKDFAKKGIYISKSMAIIHELSECLNKEKGGDITPQLGALYQFCTSHLIKANIRLDNKMIDEVINILDGLRSAYAQIIPGYEGKTAPTDTKAQATPTAPPIMPTRTPPPAAPPVESTTVAPQETPAKPVTKPQPVVPPQPLKMRSAATAAKFRAANAYTNSNR